MSETTDAKPTALVPAGAAPSLGRLLDDPATTLADLRTFLATLGPEGRIAACRTLKKRHQARLFDLAAAGGPLTPEHMVETVPGGEPVRWYGRNSLPLFRLFEKRFRRHEGQIAGINVQPNIQWFTGPGYFVCRVDPARPNELLIDYTKIPATQPPDWPAVKDNNGGGARFVYKNMYDYCRKVSDEVVIGAATRLGKPINQFFVLCRG